MLIQTYKYRLYPSPCQLRLLDDTLETCRRWYNTCLSERKEAWDQDRRTIGKFEQLRNVKVYRNENEWAGKLHSHILQVVVPIWTKPFRRSSGG